MALASIRAPLPPESSPRSLSTSCAGPGGEHIPHVECVSQTLLHVHQWDPEDEAEILIFGRPSYQKDVSNMIMNLAYYHHQLREQSSERDAAQETRTKGTPPQSGSRRPSGLLIHSRRWRPRALLMPMWVVFSDYEGISELGSKSQPRFKWNLWSPLPGLASTSKAEEGVVLGSSLASPTPC